MAQRLDQVGSKSGLCELPRITSFPHRGEHDEQSLPERWISLDSPPERLAIHIGQSVTKDGDLVGVAGLVGRSQCSQCLFT